MNFLRSKYSYLVNLYRTDTGEFWYQSMFFLFWLSIATFPIGYGAREVLPGLAGICMCFYYKYNWENSTLKRLTVKNYFYFALAMILIGVIFSHNIWESFLHASMGINKAYVLPFVGMECVRNEKKLRSLVVACVIACFWQGIDGIWQEITGKDFIMGYTKNTGRLTGSLGDYTVGNYIALAMIPAFSFWFLLKEKYSLLKCCFFSLLLLIPPVFLSIGASSRSGMLAVAASFGFWAIIIRKQFDLRIIIWPSLVFVFFYLLQTDRFSVDSVSGDGRWSLWQIAIEIFKEYPLFGAGAGQYNSLLRELNLVPAKDLITISHPHNIFLDMLYAHGIVGTSCGIYFLFGFISWGYKNIRPHLINFMDGKYQIYWVLTAWFGIGYVSWLVNGIFGHDFYRIWWIALAMTYLGIMIGAIVNGPCESEE